jgi:two-component system response regulator MprA
MTAMLLDGPRRAAVSGQRPLVLVVEHDARLAAHLERALSAANYRVERATDAEQALTACALRAPHVVILDRVVPGSDALELARRLRLQSSVPILILAAEGGLDDRIAGLDAGADDYLSRPFDPDDLLARLRALIRGRALAAAAAKAKLRLASLDYADVRLDPNRREAFRGDRRLELRNKAFELLACFLRHPERVLSRRELLEEVWGYDFLGDSNVIEVTVGHVRQALECAGESRLIHTVRPVGYILRG